MLILRPFYVAGKFGVIRGQEPRSDAQARNCWVIQVDSDEEYIVVSLNTSEFEVISPELE